MDKKLKPCPYCGDNEPEVRSDEDYNYFVECLCCLLRGPAFAPYMFPECDKAAAEATEAWNRLPRKEEKARKVGIQG